MLFSFDKLIIRCLHNPPFTNRLNEKKSRGIFSKTFRNLSQYSSCNFAEIKQIDKHFHYLTPKEIDLVANKILSQQGNTKYFRTYLHSYQVCQMSFGTEEERVIGIIEKINNSLNHPERNYLFSPLFFDFEHTFHPNLQKKKLKNISLTCIMGEKNCS